MWHVFCLRWPEKGLLSVRLRKIPRGRQSDGAIDYLERTFAQLNNESDAVARLLAERGIARGGGRVLLMVRPGFDLILITFALFKIGAVPIVIDPGMGMVNFLRCVRRSEPVALIGIPFTRRFRRLFFPYFHKVKIRVKTGCRVFNDSVADRIASADNDPFPIAQTRGKALAAILLPPVLQGHPKASVTSTLCLKAQIRLLREQALRQLSRVRSDLPLLPIFAPFNPTLGMTTVVPEMNPSRPATVDPPKIVQAIRQCGVTNSFGSPALWTRIGRFCVEHRVRLPRVRRILSGRIASPPARLSDSILRLSPMEPYIHPMEPLNAYPLASISGREILEQTWPLTE